MSVGEGHRAFPPHCRESQEKRVFLLLPSLSCFLLQMLSVKDIRGGAEAAILWPWGRGLWMSVMLRKAVGNWTDELHWANLGTTYIFFNEENNIYPHSLGHCSNTADDPLIPSIFYTCTPPMCFHSQQSVSIFSYQKTTLRLLEATLPVSVESQKSLGIYTLPPTQRCPLTNDRWVWRYWSSSFLASICIALRRDLYYPHKSSARWHRSSLLWDLAWYHTCPLSPTSLLPYYYFLKWSFLCWIKQKRYFPLSSWVIISPQLTAGIENSRSKDGQMCYEHPGRADRQGNFGKLLPSFAG